MALPTRPGLTRLLNLMLQGDAEAGNVAMHEMYAVLRRVAGPKVRSERKNSILQTTALIHDAMIRLFGTGELTVQNRQHFFALVCLTMKRILIEAGRRDEPIYVELEESVARIAEGDPTRIIAIERAQARLAEQDPEAARAFQLKVGAGMTGDETAAAMGISRASVNRALARAREWLARELAAYRS